jgi:hypothetical protein
MNFTEHFLTEIKLTILAFIGMGAWLADASQSLDLKGWDEMGLKGILLASVFFIGKLFLQSQRDHKEEMAETWKTHKAESVEREERMCDALDKHAVSLERIADLNEEQLQHFRSFVKGAVDEKMRPHG